MAYPAVDTRESRVVPDTADMTAAPLTRHGRLRAGLILAGLLSLAAVFWIAVIRLVAMA
jgi:tetrahydromethanopterin S-methyltransferase subunit F